VFYVQLLSFFVLFALFSEHLTYFQHRFDTFCSFKVNFANVNFAIF